MSRNLCQRNCYYCGDIPRLTEDARPVTPDDCGSRYFDEYKGMTVAAAECPSCEAKYLAWIDPPESWAMHGWYVNKYGDTRHFDLSFRSTFNDEPGPTDTPVYKVELQRVRVGLWRSEGDIKP